jgi:2-dehydro-3-deoxyglucarate aldolase/4-hydroxy-2-oxoheptanedioate aldolase
MKYPPIGIRGAGLARAQAYGYGGAYSKDFINLANEETMVIIMIEHIEAVKNIDEIIRVKGVDTLFIGALDLSGSMGILGQTDHPDVEAAIQKVLEACKKINMPAGITTMTPEQANTRIKQGFQNIGIGIDVAFLLNASMGALENVNKL